MESRRIALVSLHTSPLDAPGTGDAGGMNVVLLGLADALTAEGHEVELLTRAASGSVTEARTPGGALVRFLEAGPRASVAKGGLPRLTAEFGDRMRELEPFDLVHSHYWLSGAAALPVAEEWGVPHVQSLHTVAALKNARLAPGDTPEPVERLEAERMLVHASELTVTLSEAERHAILDAYAPAPERVCTVRPGVDARVFHPGPATDPGAVPALDGRPVLLVLARIQPLKGIELAIDTLARLLATDGAPTGTDRGVAAPVRPRLVVAGGTSPGHDAYAAGLRDRVAALGLVDDVTFLPAQSRPAAAELLRRAALLLVPSHSETFGLVALEAAASGTPVVAARAGGLAESVADGVSGVLLDDRSPDAWAATVAALLNDRPRLVTLSATASAHGSARGWGAAALELTRLTSALLPDPTAVFGEAPVFLHAHPDDESISTGGTLAALLAAGRGPVLLTGTRGERGEVVPGELHLLEGSPALGPHRVGELAAALDALGGVPQGFLGERPARVTDRDPREYSDSGMQWGENGFAVAAADASPASLSLAPLDEVAADVVAGIHALADGRPSSIVSYDSSGGYGHPDHVRMHEAGIEAARAFGVPFYAVVEPRVDGLREEAGGTTAASVAASVEVPVVVPVVGEALTRKVAAMAAHATQLTVGGQPPSFTLSGGQVHPVGVLERFRRMR